MNLCVIGTLAYDTVETPFGRADDALGGSALFISLAASYFVQPVGIVSIVGDDFSDEAMTFLHKRGVDTSGVTVREGGKTFRWSGRYHYDLNERDTLDTQLNVLTEFDPVLPQAMRASQFVCLGNFDPSIQLKVLDQITDPKFVICDTMNFWIESALDRLREVLERVHCLIINDSEARLLAGEPNLVKAAGKIMAMGPETLVIKKGEHGALLFTDGSVFSAPAFPLENIYDPTGAGDTFAGGFIGYLTGSGDLSDAALRRAVVYGSAMASFCVEQFSIEAIRDLEFDKLRERVSAFKELSHFDHEEVALGNTSA